MATVVTGAAGDDVHVIGIRLVEMGLRRAGHNVVSLGALVNTSEFIDAARESNADALFASSLNGHAQFSLAGLKDGLVEAGLGHVLLFAGGQLMIGRPPWDEVLALFVDRLGFDRIYDPDTSIDAVIADLEHDLAKRAAGNRTVKDVP
jgi:methylaspartate mutase sigma subunit